MNDTNILIDLVKADLLRYCPLMNLEFHTLDVIIEEVAQMCPSLANLTTVPDFIRS